MPKFENLRTLFKKLALIWYHLYQPIKNNDVLETDINKCYKHWWIKAYFD